MKRRIYKKLLEWKSSESRKPLLLLGARQVGKTWLMKEFGREEYENVAYINCDEETLTRNLFTGDYDISRLILAFQAIANQTIIAGRTLIILDEIQEAPRALHSLKYFCENAPEYHIIAAGSLLGVTLSREDSFPVGKVDMLRVYPMDFSEFLDALGQSMLCKTLKDYKSPLIDALSPKIIGYLRQYYFVGGMPEVVRQFAQNNDPKEVRRLQQAILDSYRMDISKHTTKSESVRVGLVLNSLPSQLARENKRFIYGAAKPGGRAAEFETAIQWLIDAGLVYKVCRVSKIAAPLKFYEALGVFKLFFLDVGLLCCMSDVAPSDMLLNYNDLETYNGMIAEEYVAQQLSSENVQLFYWSKENSPAEIDFVIQQGSAAIPIEVKSGTNVKGKSIAEYVKNNPEIKGLRFSLLPYKQQDWLTNIPLYAIPFL
ncbi:MAG: AAA family ATPase [Bacteroides sp.]|nr:AAA family ATPase [Bacteroides sp.]MCM1379699.1 AAA family ATPase [Bacteroides sp.]MCM1446054.1 AAA family ATPase [Prevotella sp.]